MKHISPTSIYITPMYLRLTTFTKSLPRMSFHPIFWLFLVSTGALLERSQIPSCPRQLQTCARLMQGWVASARCSSQTKILATPRWMDNNKHEAEHDATQRRDYREETQDCMDVTKPKRPQIKRGTILMKMDITVPISDTHPRKWSVGN